MVRIVAWAGFQAYRPAALCLPNFVESLWNPGRLGDDADNDCAPETLVPLAPKLQSTKL